MAQTKKYDFRITQNKKTWNAEIIRRVTSKKTAVSKSQDDFASEAEAIAWAEKELASFLENLEKRNKRDSEQRTQAQKEKALRDEAYRQKKRDSESLDAEGADTDDSNDSGSESGSEFSEWKKSGWDSAE